MDWDFVPSNIFQTALESRVYFILCSWMCLTVWRPKVCRGWEEQHSFSLHVLVDLSVSWGAARSEGIWSFLEQSETNNIINDQIPFFQNKTCWFQAWHPGDRTQQGVRVDDHDNLGGRAFSPPCLALVGSFYGKCLTRCASSIWRAPIGASGQWCHSIGSCFRWRYDGHILSQFLAIVCSLHSSVQV